MKEYFLVLSLLVLFFGILIVDFKLDQHNINKTGEQEWLKGYKVGVKERYIPDVGIEETKRKNPELMLKFRG